MTNFGWLFVDASYSPIFGADTFNEAINWDTGMRSNDQTECFPPPDLVTESEQCLGSATTMAGLFYGAAAFNQPLSFNTASVTNVRVNLCLESDRYERLDSDFQFLSNLSSDEHVVCRCNGIQSTTVF